MRLSLSMITRNNETIIGRCLDSIKDVVDEIIVVDTGSTDKTKEIVRKYTDKVYDFTWIDDFAAARNFSLEKCTGDYILWLDSDDVVPPEQAAKIKNLDLSDKEIIVSDYIYSHDSEGNATSVVPRERIIRRSLGLKWIGRIHEYIPLSGKIHKTDIEIHHYRLGGSSDRNLRILEKIVVEEPGNPRYLYYLGQEYFDIGRFKDCIVPLTKFVDDKNGWWEDHYRACDKLMQSFQQEGNEAKVWEYFSRSIEIEPRRAEPYYYLGWFYQMKNQWTKAIRWYEIAAKTEHPPELLATYQPEHYSWLPHIQLAVCYNAVGNIEKAYEHNKVFLNICPKDSRAINNDKILSEALSKKAPKAVEVLKDGAGKMLNLGCGGKAEPGYINVDLYKGPTVDECFEFDQIPYKDQTISKINSEHSLEHVGWARADKALKEWYRVLKPGGQLMLKIPDFETCCRKYIETPADNKLYRQWYKYTIYGIQRSLSGEPDDAQYHRAGWSQKEMCNKLEEVGFIIDYAYQYDGCDTPSMAILACKPVLNYKVGWVSNSMNQEAAQFRIRTFQINRWLRARGYQSEIVGDFQTILDNKFDACIVSNRFDEYSFNSVNNMKSNGKVVISDVCESLFEFPWFKEILSVSDLVICCSRELAKQVSEKVNPNVVIIEDSFEQ